MPNNYCTSTQIKAEMPEATWTTANDALLTASASYASRLIDDTCKVEHGYFAAPTTAATRYFDGNGATEFWVDPPMVGAPTTVAVSEGGVVDNAAGTGGTYTTWSTSDYLLWPYNAVAQGRPYRRLDINVFNGTKAFWYNFRKGVKITAIWGYSTTPPDDIVKATLIEATRIFKRAQSAQRDTGGIVELGKLTHTKDIDPTTMLILSSGGYIRMTI